jgi:catechol 2,3-dioxygenase-like lactoylglutathione lyase family enzyme
MLQKLSHITVYVLDQDRARAFYTDKLGLEVRADIRMGSFRWLTVGPGGQPDLELVLIPIGAAPGMDASAVAALETLVRGGKLGVGVFATTDCRATYRELSARGVVFKSEPVDRPYGVEAMFVDDSGNLFSLTQQK